MKTTQLQNLTESLASLTWTILSDLLGVSPTRLPPIYFFLSSKSKNSLRGRSLFEIDLVHRQQYLKEGITLKYPPQAYVSDLSQTPEEAAHLFALCHQPSTVKELRKKRLGLSAQQELNSMILHEAFGRFGSRLVSWTEPHSRPSLTRRPKTQADIWSQAHHQGYYLGERLSEAYFAEKVSAGEIQKWFNSNWYAEKNSPALKILTRIAKL